MRETKNLEFKSEVSNSFLKTVSAFANYEGGSILFGIDDDGSISGVKNPTDACLAIENKINDSIIPQPEYQLKIRESNSVIELLILPGPSKPYLYKSRAYKRNDSATIEVDSIEFTRLILEGKNMTFEQLPSSIQELTFDYLGNALTKHLRLSSFNKDLLKTLDLYSDANGYNNAAALLADENDFPGVDMALFGESINIIRRRVTSAKKSVLAELDDAVRFFEECFTYEEISGFTREKRESIPLEAFREALANAIVHRTWDVNAHIRVAMFEDRIEITSLGGLPVGMSEEEYLNDMVSVRRNPILANMFYRLNIIEAFGTGIHRIKAAYSESVSKPQFQITQNTITVILPVLKMDFGLSDGQQNILDMLSQTKAATSKELSIQAGFSRTKTNTILKELTELGLAKIIGSGRNTKYLKTL